MESLGYIRRLYTRTLRTRLWRYECKNGTIHLCWSEISKQPKFGCNFPCYSVIWITSDNLDQTLIKLLLRVTKRNFFCRCPEISAAKSVTQLVTQTPGLASFSLSMGSRVTRHQRAAPSNPSFSPPSILLQIIATSFKVRQVRWELEGGGKMLESRKVGGKLEMGGGRLEARG